MDSYRDSLSDIQKQYYDRDMEEENATARLEKNTPPFGGKIVKLNNTMKQLEKLIKKGKVKLWNLKK